jgi:hypothetical protein
MTDEADSKIVPAWRPFVRQFQEVFLPYFPHLTDFDAAGFEAEWLETRVHGNPKDTIRRSQAKREVAKIGAALKMMGQHDTSYWQPLFTELFWKKKESDDALAESADLILRFLLDLGEMGDNGSLHLAVDRFVAGAEKAIDVLPDRGNVNWDAVHTVDGLRVLWWRNTGKNGPVKALNPASKFASYLRDGFEFLDINADPVSAFRRWAETRPSTDTDPAPTEHPPGRSK